MDEFLILILVILFTTNLLDKAKSVKVKLEETSPLKTFDEIFGEGWWDKDEAEDLKTPAPTNFGQNVHHQIDRQNTQIGQIEPNSTDQNPHFTESDHSGQIETNSTSSNENIADDEQKRKIVDKFHAIKDEFKHKRKYSTKEWTHIEEKIAKQLKANRKKIYKWKKEFGLIRKMLYENEERKHLIEKFDQKKAELKRAGFKNSYRQEIDKTVAKELGITDRTICTWKQKLRQPTPTHKHTTHNKQKKLIERYYKIKDQNPKISDAAITKMLKIGKSTLYKWKSHFKRQQIHPNSVYGHSVEENAAANVQEIGS